MTKDDSLSELLDVLDAFSKDPEIPDVLRDALRDAVKRAEPVKPSWTEGYARDAFCGSCKSWLHDHTWAYCPRCGKKVDWS